MSNNYPPRPRWNHVEVKEAVALEYVEPVRAWADLVGAVEDGAADREYVVAVVMALRESPDAYQAGRYLDDFFDWPVTGELVKILDGAYDHMKVATRKFVLEWVAKHNVRFPAKKGASIVFRIGELEMKGTVTEVLPHEAKGIVSLNGKGKAVAVNAEEVLHVTKPAKET